MANEHERGHGEAEESAPGSWPMGAETPQETEQENGQDSRLRSRSLTGGTAAASKMDVNTTNTGSNSGHTADTRFGTITQISGGHGISVTDMDDVSIESKSRSPSPMDTETTPRPPPRHTPNPSTASTQGLSGDLPPVNFPPPPSPSKLHKPPPSPAAPTRKLTSPFSWLSRNTSKEIPKAASPPIPRRKATNASIATIASNSDLMLSKMEEDNGAEAGRDKANRNSLKDRFKLLRLREEAGISGEDEKGLGLSGPEGGAIAGMLGRSASIAFGVGSPTTVTGGDEKDELGPPPMKRVASSPGADHPLRSPTINHNLAPGTASGMTVGPSQPAEVDWDLWQNVVYEGPAAVARTSAEELNQAIASGIPQAIRGVVWQVLADSKNEGLESMYRELVARGTDKEKSSIGVPSFLRSESQASVHGAPKEKDSVRSSASSFHSDYSTPATSASANDNKAPGSPTHSSDGSNDETPVKPRPDTSISRKEMSKDEAEMLRKLEKTIKRDMGARTSYSKYMMAAGLQDGLFGVCKAYALFDEAVGYAQGMNFIAMPLLFNMPEEEAFCLLVRLMNKYNLRDMFIQDMPGLHLRLYQFERLLEDYEPTLYCHLHRRGVSPTLYATQWFLTLFAYRFPLQLVLRIYDLILSEGLGAILKFGIVLMQKNAQTLLGMKDMAQLTTFLKDKLFDVYIDKAPSANSLLESGFFGSTGGIDKEVYRADMLVQDACAIKITPQMLAAYTTEWKEKISTEKAREAELDDLRGTVHKLTLKVRSLEEHAEKSDIEHVQAASDLVRLKVENEDLVDQNESLQGQVDELRKLVDTQAAEVEERLKGEMEVVMQRNITVHNENRALEEQLQECEKVLVETKMMYAESNAEFDALKKKWSQVSAMLNSQAP